MLYVFSSQLVGLSIFKESIMYIKHGDHLTRLYGLWRNLRYRCRCKTSKDYKHYGFRGIFSCKEWDEYKVFKKWALENGYKKDLTIERKNNNGPYSPENCCFVPISENNKNKSNGYWWFVYGKRFASHYDAAKFWAVSPSTICSWCGQRKEKPMQLCYAIRKY